MSLMKIGAGVNLPGGGAYPISLAAGEVFMLPAGQGVVGSFGAVNTPQLASGNVFTGQYMIALGLYSCLQLYDPNLNYWRNVAAPGPNGSLVTVSSDGQNYRIANTTGCPVGVVITTATTTAANGFYGYVNSFNNSGQAVVIQNGTVTVGNTTYTVTPSAGGSTWNMIVGGGINTTISLSGSVFQSQGGILSPFGGGGTALTGSGGSAYTRAPIIMFTPPPNQGQQPYILPAATCTISAGAVNAVTVTQQGAGLLGLPGITVINAPGDTTGGGAVLGWTAGNSGNTGTGTLMAMYPSYYGTALTAVPTFTWSPASSTAATAIMNFSVTSITNTTPGSGYTAAYGVWQGGFVVASAANTNPLLDKAQNPLPIFPPISVAGTTAVTTLGGPFGGVNIQAVPTLAFGTQLAAGTVTTVASQTPVVGGNSDTILFIPI